MELKTSRIPFNIILSSGAYKGEVVTNEKSTTHFQVRLKNGEEFSIEAMPDFELKSYQWISASQNEFGKIIPLIGKIIERNVA
jgi:hypothetical protein